MATRATKKLPDKPISKYPPRAASKAFSSTFSSMSFRTFRSFSAIVEFSSERLKNSVKALAVDCLLSLIKFDARIRHCFNNSNCLSFNMFVFSIISEKVSLEV